MKTRAEWLDIIQRDYSHLSSAAHQELADDIIATHPDHRPEKPEEVFQAGQSVSPTSHGPDYTIWLQRIFWAIIALIVVTILSPRLFAGNGTSQIDVVCIKNSNLSGGKACFAAPFSLEMSTGFTCSRSGSTLTCTGGGTITNNPGGSTNQLQYNLAGAFGAVASGTTGQVLIWQPSGPPAFADPLVQGTQAAGSTTLPNPVPSGGSDYAGTPAVRTWKVDSSGNGYAVITTLPALPAGTNVIGHVIADSGSTTAVTGNVASTVADGANVTLGAKADAKSTATDTTAVTFMQVLKEISFMEQTPVSRAVTNAGTFAVQLSQYTPASGRLPVDGSGVTQPVSGTITGNQGTAAALSAPWPIEPAGPGSSNTITALAVCDKHIIKNSFSSSGTTLLIAAAGSSKVTRICAMALNGASTTANTVKLIYGTHVTTDCDTGAADLSLAATIQAATSTAPIGMVVSPPSNVIWDEDGNTNQQVCVNMSAAQAVNLEVWYSTTN